MADVTSRVLHFVFFAFALASAARASVHVLFLGAENSQAFATVRVAAAQANRDAVAAPPLAISALDHDFAPASVRLLSGMPSERIAVLARRRWPKNELFVIAPNAVESAGLAGVTAAFRSVVHASLPERRESRAAAVVCSWPTSLRSRLRGQKRRRRLRRLQPPKMSPWVSTPMSAQPFTAMTSLSTSLVAMDPAEESTSSS